jgi:hypothetical protein
VDERSISWLRMRTHLYHVSIWTSKVFWYWPFFLSCTVLVIPQAEVSDCEGPRSTKKESKNRYPKEVSIIEKLKRRQMLAAGTNEIETFKAKV